VACCAEGEEGRSVGVGEVMRIAHCHWAVRGRKRNDEGEFSGLAVECRGVAAGCVAPLTGGVGHETQFVNSSAVVETIDGYGPVAESEGRRQLHFAERISRR